MLLDRVSFTRFQYVEKERRKDTRRRRKKRKEKRKSIRKVTRKPKERVLKILHFERFCLKNFKIDKQIGERSSLVHHLCLSLSEDATRDQRTLRYLILGTIVATVYAFLLRYSSVDIFFVRLFLVSLELLVIILNGGVMYVVSE